MVGMAITMMSCIFCLNHVQSAALRLTAIVILPFVIYLCTSGPPVLIAIGINLLLVRGGMIFILLRDDADLLRYSLTARVARARAGHQASER